MSLISTISILVAQVTDIGYMAIAAAFAVFTGIGAGVGMGIATGKAVEALARQPEIESKIRTFLMIGLAFAETTAIYGLFIAILIVVNIL